LLRDAHGRKTHEGDTVCTRRPRDTDGHRAMTFEPDPPVAPSYIGYDGYG
jgi:hypothetical protein